MLIKSLRFCLLFIKALSQKEGLTLTTEILNLKINQCFIQYEKFQYEDYIRNARNLLFGNLKFVLESENVNGIFINIIFIEKNKNKLN